MAKIVMISVNINGIIDFISVGKPNIIENKNTTNSSADNKIRVKMGSLNGAVEKDVSTVLPKFINLVML